MFEHLGKDVRHGVRSLRKHLGFSIIVVLTLALGIGATAAVFSLIQGVLLTARPTRPGIGVFDRAADDGLEPRSRGSRRG